MAKIKKMLYEKFGRLQQLLLNEIIRAADWINQFSQFDQLTNYLISYVVR